MSDLIIVAASSGNVCVFDEKDIKTMGRSAQGIRGIRIKKSAKVTCIESFSNTDKEILIISEKGFGKKLKINELQIKSRGGCGIKIMNISSKSGYLKDVKVIPKNGKIVIIATEKGIIKKIELNGIANLSRNTLGTKLIKLTSNDKVSSINII